MGKAFLDMLGVFAEFETNLRKERQMEGIAKAKTKVSIRAVSPPSTKKKFSASRHKVGWLMGSDHYAP